MTPSLLEITGLTKAFPMKGRAFLGGQAPVLKAVDGISFTLARGETLGLVGESGCGKSTTARLILRLIEPSGGSVRLDGRDLLGCTGEQLRALRREMQIVFQDPLSSLNPRMSVGTNLAEPLRFHGVGTRRERSDEARRLLEVVGLQPHEFDRFPHELSGGQCQRLAIARALILKPKLIIFDEPVSALDVSIRAQILKLLLELQQRFGLTYIFISHDLSVVKRVSDRIAVMYLGRIVEIAESARLHAEPRHPYTRSLLQAIPLPDPRLKRIGDFALLEGDLPSPANPPSGCRFHTRCAHRLPRCPQEEPLLREITTGHLASCFLYQ
jgi:oligopeptide/dipeptide ABC transporter ATP-binding protein